MSPQSFVKKLPFGYSEERPPVVFQFLRSIPEGFLAAYREKGTSYIRWEKYTPALKIAVRLPDGRLVIPTVKGEKSK